ncbi:MAG TPA: hypothetical protein VGH95_05755 [Candidatus Aquirickettsiella sp.]|jgi:hypothetical protein
MPQDISQIAIAAKNYARQYIKKGCTQLENNSYPIENQRALEIAVTDIRDEIHGSFISEKEEIFYERKIEILKKYSIGNCGEMSQLALYYVVTHYPSLYAEYHSIHNGDHVVLIIGKKKPSRPCLEAWDEEAYICDPWSNKIYRVCEWQQHLKNYTYNFINNRPINATVPLNATQSLIPDPDFNSINFNYHGSTYRKSKIKSVLYLFRPFKDIFHTECLDQLLCGRYFLRDYDINEPLETTEQALRETLVKQSIDLLKRFEEYLQRFQNDPEFLKKCALPVSNQLQKIHSAIACLDNLLKVEFSIMVKDILKKYPCPSSKKIAVAEAIAKAEDINSFTSYFYESLKPTLEIKRNPNLDKFRGFFTSKSITVKGAQVAQQLEKLIGQYSSSQLRPS